MAGSLNRVSLIGNCGADPEIRVTQGGKKVASLRIATSESWTDKASGEKKEVTDWHSIVVWNEHLIPVIEKYVKKGSKVMIEGQLKTRKWQDKDGNDRYTTEVVIQRFGGQLLLLDSKGSGGGDERTKQYEDMDRSRYGDRSQQSQGRQQERKPNYDDLNDEIPF
jgi:single-strand DNA-binding protein